MAHPPPLERNGSDAESVATTAPIASPLENFKNLTQRLLKVRRDEVEEQQRDYLKSSKEKDRPAD